MVRRVVPALLAALLVLLGPSPATAQPATAQPPAAGDADALGTVASCLRERGHLLVLALIDESGSLQNADAENRRVAGLRAALRSFAQFGRGPDSTDSPRIDVLLAAFGTGFGEVGGWTSLNGDTLPELESRAAEFAQRNQAVDTDFAAAVDGAKGALTRRAAEATGAGLPEPCRLLLMFTDGQYDIVPRSGEEKPYAPGIPLSDDTGVEDAGRRFLCDPAGVADQLRATGTVVVAVALRPADGPAPDQSFLRGLAEAQGGGCGDLRAPPGVFVEADGLGRLLEAFDTAVTREILIGDAIPGRPETPVCAADDADSRCVRTFRLDEALSEFHILVNLARPGIAVDISAPDAGPERLRAGTDRRFSLGGAELDVVSLSDLDLVIDASLPPGDPSWVGTWTIRFVDETGTNADAVTRSQITVFGGLTPVVDPRPTFTAGQPSTFDIDVVDAAGSPRTPAEFVRTATVAAAVVSPDGQRTPLRLTGPVAGSYRTSYTVPAEATYPSIDLEMTLNVTTRGGLRLQPRVQTYHLPVRPPAGYPVLTPTELVLSPIIDEGEAAGAVTVTGTPGGTGCVWFGGLDAVSAPDGAGSVTARYQPAAVDQASCLRVEPGQSVAVDLRAQPEAVRNGLVAGGLRVLSTGAEPEVRETVVPVRFEMERNPALGPLVALLVLLLVLGALLPLALLWGLNRYLARFQTPGLLRRAVKDVRVGSDDVELLEPWPHPISRGFGPVTAPRSDASPEKASRSFVDDDLQFVARVPLLPLQLPYGVVQCDGRDVFASGGAEGRGERRRGRVSFGLHPTWVFVVDRVELRSGSGSDADRVVYGRLYLYVSDEGVVAKASRLWERTRVELPAAVAAAAATLSSGDFATVGGGPDRGPHEPPSDPDVFVPPVTRT
jgi:hypothetical protein